MEYLLYSTRISKLNIYVDLSDTITIPETPSNKPLLYFAPKRTWGRNNSSKMTDFQYQKKSITQIQIQQQLGFVSLFLF